VHKPFHQYNQDGVGKNTVPLRFREFDRRLTIWLNWRQYNGPLPFWKVPKENTVRIIETKEKP